MIAVGVLLFSAFLHALWNGLLRQAGDKYIAMWWALLIEAAVTLPFLWLAPPIPPDGWIFVFASAGLEALYCLLLMSAYRYGDFSVVYPIARGTSPGLLALWAYLFLGERPSLIAGLGIAVLVAGLIVVGINSRRTATAGTPSYRSVGLALAVAVLISLYSVVDGAAVQKINAFSYSAHIFALIPLMLTPLMFWRYGTQNLVNVWRLSAPRLIITGILMAGSYLLVLLVYQIAPVGYAGAVREVSVVFAALLGRVWFQEQVGLQRAIGIACIFGGVLLVTVG